MKKRIKRKPKGKKKPKYKTKPKKRPFKKKIKRKPSKRKQAEVKKTARTKQNMKKGSLNQRKDLALKAIRRFPNNPPSWGLHQLAGVSRQTFSTWKKKDSKFSEELEEILVSKRLKMVGDAQGSLVTLANTDHNFNAIKMILENQDSDNWGHERLEEAPVPALFLGIYGAPRGGSMMMLPEDAKALEKTQKYLQGIKKKTKKSSVA